MAEPGNNPKRESNGSVGNCRPPVEHQFKPGNQASKGVSRGKGPQLKAMLERVMRGVEPADPQQRKRVEIAALSLFQQAVKGNGTAIKELWGRLCGPIPNVHEGGDPDRPMRIIIEEYTEEAAQPAPEE